MRDQKPFPVFLYVLLWSWPGLWMLGFIVPKDMAIMVIALILPIEFLAVSMAIATLIRGGHGTWVNKLSTAFGAVPLFLFVYLMFGHFHI